jgi:hypothetical protein
MGGALFCADAMDTLYISVGALRSYLMNKRFADLTIFIVAAVTHATELAKPRAFRGAQCVSW